MDNFILILLYGVIGALLGYIVFKDVLYHRHLETLEKKLMARNLTEYDRITGNEVIDPDAKENKMAKPDKYLDLDDAPNPFI